MTPTSWGWTPGAGRLSRPSTSTRRSGSCSPSAQGQGSSVIVIQNKSFDGNMEVELSGEIMTDRKRQTDRLSNDIPCRAAPLSLNSYVSYMYVILYVCNMNLKKKILTRNNCLSRYYTNSSHFLSYENLKEHQRSIILFYWAFQKKISSAGSRWLGSWDMRYLSFLESQSWLPQQLL